MDPHFFTTMTFKTVPVAQPAAGAEWSVTVPNGVEWEIVSGRWTLVTSAAVANRVSRITISDAASNVLLRASAGANQIASVTNDYGMQASNTSGIPAGNTGAVPIPPEMILPAGFVIASTTNAIDVADQYSNICLYVVEYVIP